MPLYLDIYCLTRHRDIETINRFIDAYVDRERSEETFDELMIRRLDAASDDQSAEAYEWRPARTLREIVEIGLEHPRRCFTAYLRGRLPEMEHLLLSFTTDDRLILGLSIPCEGYDYRPEELTRGKELMLGLAEEFDAHCGFMRMEAPPPSSEEEMRMELPSAPYSFTR